MYIAPGMTASPLLLEDDRLHSHPSELVGPDPWLVPRYGLQPYLDSATPAFGAGDHAAVEGNP